MKLTREQVSKLSDVELNRAMIWCYPPKGYHFHADRVRHWLLPEGKVDYLTDYNLTMPLVFNIGSRYILSSIPAYQLSKGKADKNPLRAICEVLLMIAMEREA